MRNRWRQLIKQFHPEGIPWPGSLLYNAISNTAIFHQHYELVAHDVVHYGTFTHILDIGTGPGHLLFAIQKLLPEAELVGVDISSAMIAQAQRNLKKDKQNSQIQFRVADARALPFANGTFHCIVPTGSLHHWKDPIHALSEVHRVLRPGGHALIYDLVRDLPEAVSHDIYTNFGGFRLALLWLHSFEEPFLNAEEMEALGRRTAFVVEGTRFTGALCCLMLRKTAISAMNRT